MINRSKTCYVEIPPEIQSGGRKRKDAKMQVSLNLVVPAEFEKKGEKFMKDALKAFDKSFQRFMQDLINKAMEKEGYY